MKKKFFILFLVTLPLYTTEIKESTHEIFYKILLTQYVVNNQERKLEKLLSDTSFSSYIHHNPTLFKLLAPLCTHARILKLLVDNGINLDYNSEKPSSPFEIIAFLPRLHTVPLLISICARFGVVSDVIEKENEDTTHTLFNTNLINTKQLCDALGKQQTVSSLRENISYNKELDDSLFLSFKETTLLTPHDVYELIKKKEKEPVIERKYINFEVDKHVQQSLLKKGDLKLLFFLTERAEALTCMSRPYRKKKGIPRFLFTFTDIFNKRKWHEYYFFEKIIKIIKKYREHKKFFRFNVIQQDRLI